MEKWLEEKKEEFEKRIDAEIEEKRKMKEDAGEEFHSSQEEIEEFDKEAA